MLDVLCCSSGTVSRVAATQRRTEVDPFLGLGYPIDTFVECQAKAARSPEPSLLVFSVRVYLSVSRLQSATERPQPRL